MTLSPDLLKKLQLLEQNIAKVIVGKERQIRFALITLLCKGHLLIEDVPGVGKTVLAKTMAKSIDGDFKRIQFTPDLLPADVTGVSIFNPQNLVFEFRQGPVFTNILLSDEINRATPRTQSSLLEAMEERQVTIDGTTHILPEPFFVMATQNPIEQQGTFPLPEAQIDRFFLCLKLGYPEKSEEIAILEAQREVHPLEEIRPVITLEDLLKIQKVVSQIPLHEDLKDYIVSIVRSTRIHKDVLLGASPRASLALMRASQAYGLFGGRSFVTPQMIKDLSPWVLGHRIIIHPQSRISGVTSGQVIEEILKTLPVPDFED